jgi:glycosyltransferase involved in cell wall biosynthesis
MKKLVYISNMAAPYQVKFCYALQEHFDAEFWFYEYVEASRPAWWKIPLGDKCKILPKILIRWRKKYFTFSLLRELKRFNPDIVMLGGMTIPGNYLAYRWAKRHKKKIVLFSEFRHDTQGNPRDSWASRKLLHWLYRKIDLLIGAGKNSQHYFVDVCGFPADKVLADRYPADIEPLLAHPTRTAKEAYSLLFAHRLVPMFNPLLAIDIFAEIHRRHPESTLRLNAAGPMREQCKDHIEALGLSECASFLDGIESWDGLQEIYRTTDISISPCGKGNNGFGAVLQLLASGAGVVISDQIVNTSAVIAKTGGGFVVPLEKQAFVDAVEQYIQNPDLFTIHRQRSSGFVSTRTNKNTAQRYADHLNSKLWPDE